MIVRDTDNEIQTVRHRDTDREIDADIETDRQRYRHRETQTERGEIDTSMARKTVEEIPSATLNSPRSLGRVKLFSRDDVNILWPLQTLDTWHTSLSVFLSISLSRSINQSINQSQISIVLKISYTATEARAKINSEGVTIRVMTNVSQLWESFKPRHCGYMDARAELEWMSSVFWASVQQSWNEPHTLITLM